MPDGPCDLLVFSLLDERHPPEKIDIAGMKISHLLEKTRVDLINDLEMTGDNLLQKADRPLLQSFGQDRVVGISQSVLCQLPGMIPGKGVFIHEKPHQFRYRQGWMGIVHLNGYGMGKTIKILVILEITADNVPQGAGHQKVFLHQAELLA
jgi:hypothetical protein